MTKFNVANDLNAQGANVGNAQHVADVNQATHNAETVHNADANQTVFSDEMAKASGKAGTLNQWANQASDASKAEHGADMALTGGLINAGATAGGFAMGGPAGAAAAGSVTDGATGAPTGYKPKVADNQYAALGYADGGEVKAPESTGSLEDEYDKFMQTFACGGTVKMADGGSVTVKPGKDLRGGGQVPGQANVSGDSPKNDTVPALLSPGEVVLPRTEVAELQNKPGDPLAAALRRLKNNSNIQVGAVRG
jgi:hypothetical protein